MNTFEYASPSDINQIAHLLGDDAQAAAILAGGTDLIALMKDEVIQPRRIVNIKAVKALDGITATHDGLRIGALSRLQDLADNASIRKFRPALAEALDEAASPQIRNMATLGGNLLQRPRCWYFRTGFGLLALDKNGGSLVLKGDNRYHAILGNDGPAYFVSPSTIAPVLIAYDAKVVILGRNGKLRTLSLQDLYCVPKKQEEVEHTLAPGELLTDIHLPAAATNERAATYEVRQKNAFDWPLATAAVVVRMSGNTVQSARVVMGHVAPIPWVSKDAEQALIGKPLDEKSAEAAAMAAVRNAKSLGNNSHKIQCARVAVKRAIMKAAG